MSGAPRAVVADDEPLLRDALAAALARAWPELEVVAACGDGDAALEAIRRERPDVAFLDIRMPGRDGLQVAREGAALEAPPLWVFVTAYDEHALEAFDREAVDYLVKPIDARRLERAVARLRARLAERATRAPAAGGAVLDEAALRRLAELIARPAAPPLRWLRASLRDEVRLIAVDDVVVLEAADKYVRVLTRDEEALVRMPLKELLERLPPDEFWRIHRGTVVRAREIARTVRSPAGRLVVHLRSRPERLEVSRAFAHLFRAD
ncbi:MAG TPA: LytTR family DNA-binding domain-containing protein [Burkholderiaceae bacterium]|nr:LytTR family DNA-binding domain-containing protein [Burkholderiaceae bacterium]